MNYNSIPILSITNLTVSYNRYGTVVRALDDLSINSIAAGSWTFITGSNGSGKSTLFNIISKRILNYTGSARLNGKEIKEISPKHISQQIFLITQNPLACTVDEFTVWENLKYATSHKTTEEFEVALHNSRLINHKDHLVKNLSGGQRQLLALQIARLRSINILLLDEPFAALDAENMTMGLEIVKQIHLSGTTILFITHDIKLMHNYLVDKTDIYKIDSGKLIS